MRSRRSHRGRLLTWVVIGFNLAMLLWLVTALDAAGEGNGSCVGEPCRETDGPDSAMGAWLVILFWLTGAVLLGVAWLLAHRTDQPGRGPRRGRHR